MGCDLSKLDSEVRQWPGVARRTTRTQIVFSIAGRNFCWLSPTTGMVQLFPPLGPREVTRRLERHGSKVKVIRQRTGEYDAEYHDPSLQLGFKFSYPGFMCSRTPQDEAESLVRQAYEQAQRWANVSGRAFLPSMTRAASPDDSLRGESPPLSKTGMAAKVIQVPMEEALAQKLDSWSQKLGRSRADVIREACRRYLKRVEREDMDRNYREGYDRFPEEPIMAHTQVTLIAEVLPKEEW